MGVSTVAIGLVPGYDTIGLAAPALLALCRFGQGLGLGGEWGGAIQSVSNSQTQASRMQREVQLDNPNVSIEETMVAMQKAQIGFQATLQVRNKLVQAYSDIMNMQV